MELRREFDRNLSDVLEIFERIKDKFESNMRKVQRMKKI